MIFVVQLKRCMINASIFGIVISKLSLVKESSSVILFEVNKSIKIGLFTTILTLGLAISPRVKRSKKFAFDLNEIAKR